MDIVDGEVKDDVDRGAVDSKDLDGGCGRVGSGGGCEAGGALASKVRERRGLEAFAIESAVVA